MAMNYAASKKQSERAFIVKLESERKHLISSAMHSNNYHKWEVLKRINSLNNELNVIISVKEVIIESKKLAKSWKPKPQQNLFTSKCQDRSVK